MGPRTDWDFSAREAEILRELPQRLAPLTPELIMLFGSRAAGTARKDSDYDVLVVMTVKNPREPRTTPVRRLLRGLGVPLDVIVYTPDEWQSFKKHPQAFAHEIAEHGKVLHGAA